MFTKVKEKLTLAPPGSSLIYTWTLGPSYLVLSVRHRREEHGKTPPASRSSGPFLERYSYSLSRGVGRIGKQRMVGSFDMRRAFISLVVAPNLVSRLYRGSGGARTPGAYEPERKTPLAFERARPFKPHSYSEESEGAVVCALVSPIEDDRTSMKNLEYLLTA